MLVLFDIDGTLLHSHGQGRAGMDGALEELFGIPDGCDGVDFAGALDRNIFAALCARHGIDGWEAHEPRFRAAYTARLAAALARPPKPHLYPGVVELVDALSARPGTHVGLLTGNYAETARLKVAAAGLDPERFVVGAWGDDGAHRPDLLPVALNRLQAATGRRVRPTEVVVVGDTPRDVECAAAHGCRSLAVCTGFSGREALEAARPDHLLDDLSDTAAVLAWMGSVTAG